MSEKVDLLSGKVAIITGSGRGLGAMTAKVLASRKASVVVNYLQDTDSASETLKEIKSQGGSGIVIRADVRERDQVDRMVEETLRAFGRIDILINNSHTPFIPQKFAEISWGDIEEQIRGTVTSAFNCSQAVLKTMLANRSGRIINISSFTTNAPDLSFGHGFLTRITAKAALLGFSRTLAEELASSDITVNVISPGWLHTPQTASYPNNVFSLATERTPAKRLATLEEVANAILFYASDLSNFVTGTDLPVCGGTVMN